MELLCDGMSIETKRPLFIFLKRIEGDIIISFENQVVENQYLFDT
jgi:hypothetical protein